MHEFGLGHDGSDVSKGPEDERRALWKRVFAEHLQPSRLFRLAMGLAGQLPEDAQHLAACSECRSVYQRYRSHQAEGNHAYAATDVESVPVAHCDAGASDT